MVVKIARLELSKLFSSPVAWLVLALFAAKTGAEIRSHLSDIFQSTNSNETKASLIYILFSVRSGVFVSVCTSLYILLPLLTMGLISQEVSSGSIKRSAVFPLRQPHTLLLSDR